jgi:hypothetical protein
MNDCNGNAKKSLMNSLETLNNRAQTLGELSRMSGRLLRKFTNPMPEPENGEKIMCDPEPLSKQPDLIDLFNITADRIQREIEIIGKNMEVLAQMVD